MSNSGSVIPSSGFSLKLLGSYVFDWIVLIVIAAVGAVLSNITPNKRPFSLSDPNISFPFTERETVPTWLLVVLSCGVPVVVIFLISFILVPGNTVPKNTSLALVWRRKAWELHVGWLGLLMAVASSFFVISGVKNMCGKPRPDLLSRCQPDLANAAQYIVGGFLGESETSHLYSGAICKNPDTDKLDDGFRSYPSGHAAASASGLIYLSLFLASKFSVTLPFAVTSQGPLDDSMHSAFPSRMNAGGDAYEASHPRSGNADFAYRAAPNKSRLANSHSQHNTRLMSLRRQAAAPPIYLLAITLIPFCLSVFISASRWFDFRHHGFDILFGYLIGAFTALYSFRFYHLPIMAGAGWAWGPRSDDRAFWAGVGRLGFAGDNSDEYPQTMVPADLGESGDVDYQNAHGSSSLGGGSGGGVMLRGDRQQNGQGQFKFNDVEMDTMDESRHPAADAYGRAQ